MIEYDKIKTLDNKLRELLAQEYEHQNGPKDAEFIRLTKYRGAVSVDLAVAAMHRAYKAGWDDLLHAVKLPPENLSAPDYAEGQICECGTLMSNKNSACKYPGNHSGKLNVPDTCDYM